uniref:V-SNARE coiled-coil homology domain-containing protein n=1 Tax=Globisporangium ultimum (strain ATCC 200006 / CBS 805.95 / DAOM BR144) TaxID=431595 RepID=K3XBK8_GLOUD
MSVVYALIARQQSVLCEYTDKSGNFPTVTRVVLKQLAQQQGSADVTPGATKSVFPYNEFNFFFLREDGLTYMCMAEEQVQTNVAFAMLAELKDAFVAHYGEQGKTAIAFGMMPFASTLEALMKKYDNYKIDTPLSQIRQKMEKVKMVMIENVNQLMDRGEKIDLLVMRTDKLQKDALVYEKTAKKVKNVYWWKNVKYWVFIALLLCLLALALSFMVCGIDFESCGARIESSAGNELDKLGQWSESNVNKAGATVSAGISNSGNLINGN